MTVHLVFDVKLDTGFTRKARLVADEHKVHTPPSMAYEYVMSRESIRIVLMIGDINGLYVKCANVKNAYLNVNPKDHVYF